IGPATVIGAAAGGIAGLVVLGAFAELGLTLMRRVASPIPLVVLVIAGAYAGWLLGVVVFGAVRGGNTEKEQRG
ncbi:MAG TPA: hypothetical protein VEW68_00515, partial [Patescibacteria group bacterium]|nr:hypothetical protein [Patescibacteria group bacterium]